MAAPAFVVPQANAPSGGHAYNAAVLAHWPGTPPTVVRLDGPWPRGDEASMDGLRAAFRGREVALVDGLVGAAHPETLERAQGDGCRIVLLIHLPLADEGGLPERDRAELASLERRSVRAAWRVVATSRTAAASLESSTGRTDVVAIAPGGYPAPLARRHDPPGIVQVGAIGPRKNQLASLHALAQCRDLAFTATLAGPVADQAYAERVRSGLDAAGATWTGPLDDAGLDALYAGADLLVHPAVAETWGMVITEALARGIPAIVAAGTGAVEALASGGASGLPGAVVDLDDPDALRRTLRRWLDDPELRHQWRERAAQARAGLRRWPQPAAELAALLEEAVMTEAGSTEAAGRPERPIAADWLALRRAADTSARDGAAWLLSELTERLAEPVTVFDIGAGTGANQAYLTPRLGVPSRWVLLDHDADLLLAPGHGSAERVLGGIDELRGLVAAASGPRLVSCSALLDLLSTDELDELASVLSRLGVPGLFSLTVDGSLILEPRNRLDEAVSAAFNAHQARAGRPGPAAAAYLAQRCAQAGLVVRQAETPWVLGPGAEALIERLLTERADAAVEQQPGLAADALQWLAERLTSLRDRSLRVQVGHVDLLVRPPH